MVFLTINHKIPKKIFFRKTKTNLKFGKVVIIQKIFVIIHYQTKNGIHSSTIKYKIVSLSKDYCISSGRNYAVMKNDLDLVFWIYLLTRIANPSYKK